MRGMGDDVGVRILDGFYDGLCILLGSWGGVGEGMNRWDWEMEEVDVELMEVECRLCVEDIDLGGKEELDGVDVGG